MPVRPPAQVEIDTWPRIPPYLEIEASSTEEVIRIASLLGYTETDLTGENTMHVYARHGIDLNAVNELTFASDASISCTTAPRN